MHTASALPGLQEDGHGCALGGAGKLSLVQVGLAFGVHVPLTVKIPELVQVATGAPEYAA